MRGVSVFSSSPISPEKLATVMKRLNAEPAGETWRLIRNGRSINVQIDNETLEDTPERELKVVARLLGADPVTCVVISYLDDELDHLERQMAKAFARAMSDIWPVVFYDHLTPPERIQPPTRRQQTPNQ